MKYIILIYLLLSSCSKKKEAAHISDKPVKETHEVVVVPENIQKAVKILLSDQPYDNQGEVQKAAELLMTFETPERGITETLVDTKGNYSTAISYTFPKLGIEICFHDQKVTGASRIEKKK